MELTVEVPGLIGLGELLGEDPAALRLDGQKRLRMRGNRLAISEQALLPLGKSRTGGVEYLTPFPSACFLHLCCV